MIQKYRDGLKKWSMKLVTWSILVTMLLTLVEPLLFPWWARVAAHVTFLVMTSTFIVWVVDSWWKHKRDREDEITRALSTFLQVSTGYVLDRRRLEEAQKPLDTNLYRAAADYLSILRLKEASGNDAEIDRRASAKLLEVLERVKKEEVQ